MEEKGSDVNLAVHLVNDAWKKSFDAAVVISNDTDLVTPIRMVSAEQGKPVFVVCPVASEWLRRWPQLGPENGMLGRPCSGPRSFRKTSQAARSRSPPPGEAPCYPTGPRHTPGATGIGSSGRDAGQGRPEREAGVRQDHRTPEGIHSRMAYRHLDLPRVLDPDTINVRRPMAAWS